MAGGLNSIPVRDSECCVANASVCSTDVFCSCMSNVLKASCVSSSLVLLERERAISSFICYTFFTLFTSLITTRTKYIELI